MIGGLGNCPLCWDDPEICKCTQKELDAYYNGLKLSKKKTMGRRETKIS